MPRLDPFNSAITLQSPFFYNEQLQKPDSFLEIFKMEFQQNSAELFKKVQKFWKKRKMLEWYTSTLVMIL